MIRLRALLLAAGFGTRLRPLTLKIPKCLVRINDKPILKYWLEKLESLNTESVLINTHYLHTQVDDFLKNQSFSKIKVGQFYEKELLGTAGTLLANKSFFCDSIGLLIHADNFSSVNLNDFVKAHKNRPSHCLLTMLTFNTKTPSNCGIVEIDKDGVVVGFHEKASNPPSNKANGAIYAFDFEFIKWLEIHCPQASDFSTEVIPELIGRISTWHTNESFIDIGTPSSLYEANHIKINS